MSEETISQQAELVAQPMLSKEDLGKHALTFSQGVEANDVTWVSGKAQVWAVVVYGNLTVTLKWPNGTKRKFTADSWGAGIGDANAAGGGPWSKTTEGKDYIPPVGTKMHFQITSVASVAGEIQIFWWIKTGQILGSFVGVAAGAAAWEGGGTGKWTNP
ncbi:MAG: hypothetical protein U0359_26725 [Byssovorax sp.]